MLELHYIHKTITCYLTGLGLTVVSAEAATYYVIFLTTGFILSVFIIKKPYDKKKPKRK